MLLVVASFFLSLILSLGPCWADELRLLLLSVSEALSCRSVAMPVANEAEEMTVLDLPELALECILEKLSPSGLRNMAGVCRSLRSRCRSDHLWERHMREKWGRVLGKAAHRHWQLYVALLQKPGGGATAARKGWIQSLSVLWRLSWLKSKLDSGRKIRRHQPIDSIMSWYLGLESGRFWFPAQVYNRENGHVGFMLSCYDAEVSYDRRTDSFHARYLPHGRRAINVEEGVQWDRIRAPPVDTPAHMLHVSDCLKDLRPGDHIEIQWRRNKEFPYGWWYGAVGHLKSCDGNDRYCRCHSSDTVILEFKQYTPGSRWRQKVVNRNDHKEEGNETDGFYAGIRKLHCKDEISTWRRLWPAQVLE